MKIYDLLHDTDIATAVSQGLQPRTGVTCVSFLLIVIVSTSFGALIDTILEMLPEKPVVFMKSNDPSDTKYTCLWNIGILVVLHKVLKQGVGCEYSFLESIAI
jgi:hypothetical protein